MVARMARLSRSQVTSAANSRVERGFGELKLGIASENYGAGTPGTTNAMAGELLKATLGLEHFEVARTRGF